ncbi:hypothetical protein TcBrA4_0034470 [Trypanosoma cruzi]|nr:hypothetical protein TcBrA4_0034470 [Trypanosoma cruzi]
MVLSNRACLLLVRILVGKTIPISEAKLENAALDDTRLLKRDCSMHREHQKRAWLKRVMLTENSGNRLLR